MIRPDVPIAMLLAALVSLTAPSAAQAFDGRDPRSAFAPAARHVTCESRRFQRATCPADTRSGVRLVQQTSGICTKGRTWGVTPRAIWVDNGCRAIFAVAGGRHDSGRRGG